MDIFPMLICFSEMRILFLEGINHVIGVPKYPVSKVNRDVRIADPSTVFRGRRLPYSADALTSVCDPLNLPSSPLKRNALSIP